MTETIQPGRRVPEWIRVRVHEGENFKQLKQLVQERRFQQSKMLGQRASSHTVCRRRPCTICFSSLKLPPSVARIRIHSGIVALTAGCYRASTLRAAS